AVVSANDVWAVDYYDNGQYGGDLPLTIHWDGSSWTQVPIASLGTYGYYLRDVAAVSSNDVWAVGSSRDYNANPFVDRTLVLHWNGSNWSAVPSPNPGPI